jgi:hypothetical protein
VSAVERRVGMMRRAARGRDLRVLDLDQRRLEPGKLVPLPLEQPAERGQLHGVVLERAVGKEKRHGGTLRRNRGARFSLRHLPARTPRRERHLGVGGSTVRVSINVG